MKKSLFAIISILIVSSTMISASEKKIVECRLVTPKTTECRPYPSKYMYTEKLEYGNNRQKLIVSKTLPVPQRPKLIKIVSVEDMLEDHFEIMDSVRFSGSRPSPLRMTEEEKRAAKAEKQRAKALAMQIEAEQAAQQKQAERSALRKKQEREAQKRALLEEEKLLETGEKRETVVAKAGKKEAKKVTKVTKATKKERVAKSKKTGKEKAKKRKLAKKKEKKSGSKQSTLAKKLEEKYIKLKKKKRSKSLNEYNAKLVSISPKGKRRLRVQATAYTSHRGQTDKTPFLAAWNNHIRPGMKIIAVSRDLIKKYGLSNGKKVRIQGLPGHYTVRDKMNKRYTRRIDIYMGTNRRKALRWGRRRTVIYWD